MSGYFEGLVGQRLGGYVVKRMIARGGMGVVYEAYQESLDRPVAIKILYPHLSDDPGFRERFQREARALAQLNHPNIVRVIDFDVSGQFVYMVMELVNGHSLRDELIALRDEGRVMGIPRALEILQAVGNALNFAHERGFVHRDVKPGNILIDEGGNVFLTDFGLVKLEDVAGATATGAVMGTPEYMAPEQFLATSAAGPAADQYALAVVAYEMLAGRVPFQAETPVGLLQKHLEEPPPSLSASDDGLPESVEPVILRGLAKDPNERYPTVSTFIRDLEASTTSRLPTIATAPTLTEPARQPVTQVSAPASTPGAQPATTPPAAPLHGADPQPGAASGGPPPRATIPPAASAGRPGWIKWVVLAIIPLLVVGVVGATMLGGGDDDPSPTATTLAVVDPTATEAATEPATVATEVAAEPTATATATESPTEVVPTPTATTPAAPTETRPPVVVTRPIQNVPTPTTGLITIPTPSDDDGEFSTVVSSDFVEGEPEGVWAIITDQPEFTTQISESNYVVDILADDPNGYTVFSYPDGANEIADGAMAVRVRVDGGGGAGVMLRRSQAEDGTVSMYECHIYNTQEFSCWEQVNGQWAEIVPRQYAASIVPNDYNTVAIGAIGADFALQINDVDVAAWTDDSLASGAWGVFVERDGGATHLRAYYDAVLIVRD